MPYLLTTLSIIAVSCDPNMVYDHFEKTAQGKWSWDDVKTFNVDMKDTTSAFNIYVDIRHTKAFPKSNLYVFLNIVSPKGVEINDTVSIGIADSHGKWLGSGFGNIRLVRKLYKRDIRFAVPETIPSTLNRVCDWKRCL